MNSRQPKCWSTTSSPRISNWQEKVSSVGQLPWTGKARICNGWEGRRPWWPSAWPALHRRQLILSHDPSGVSSCRPIQWWTWVVGRTRGWSGRRSRWRPTTRARWPARGRCSASSSLCSLDCELPLKKEINFEAYFWVFRFNKSKQIILSFWNKCQICLGFFKAIFPLRINVLTDNKSANN